MPEGQKGIARGEAPGRRNNTHKQPQKGRKKKGICILAGTFTFLGIHQYIRNQQNHHRERSFQEEFIDMLNKYGVKYDVVLPEFQALSGRGIFWMLRILLCIPYRPLGLSLRRQRLPQVPV